MRPRAVCSRRSLQSRSAMTETNNSDEAALWLDLARKELALENYDRAARLADKALRLHPSDQA